MRNVYIVDAKRTAIGSMLGQFKNVEAKDLAIPVVKNILENNNVPKDKIDEVIFGNILSSSLGQNIARQITLGAGIPDSVCAYTVNMVCGSGMKAIMNGANAIQQGADLVIAGGVENMTRAPFVTPRNLRQGQKLGHFQMQDTILVDALTDAFNQYHMGITAENVAEKYDITREKQDEFALQSQQRAIAAVDSGRFKDEIVPIEVVGRKETVTIDVDEYPNRSTNLEKLGKLRPAFKKDGSVTAGNASGINDGASVVLLASEDAVKAYNLKPLAKIVACGQGGVDPAYMGLGPTKAIENAMKKTDLAFTDLGLLELNEAFAAQFLGVSHELQELYGVTEDYLNEITNVNGGAIALGHPVGASGNRIVVTLIHEMLKRDTKYGLASLCIGGGMGTCLILEKV